MQHERLQKTWEQIEENQSYDPFSRLQKLAESGDAAAQYDLGYCLFHGRGLDVDKTKAAQWWQKAADQGLAKARQ